MPKPKRKLPKYPKDAPFRIVEPKFAKPKPRKPTVKRTMKKGPEGRMQPVGPDPVKPKKKRKVPNLDAEEARRSGATPIMRTLPIKRRMQQPVLSKYKKSLQLKRGMKKPKMELLKSNYTRSRPVKR